MKYAALIFSNFKRHRTRTILTILSILVAFILFAYLAAIKNAFRFGTSVAGANRLVTRHRVTLIQPLPQSYERQIEQIRGVKDATQQAWFGGLYRNEQAQWGQIAVVPAEFFAMYPEFVLPDAQKEAFLETRTAAIVGRTTAAKYGWKVGDRIPLTATYMTGKSAGNLWTFDLVGIYDGKYPETDTTTFYFRHDYMDENRLRGKGLTGWYTVKVEDPNDAERVAREIDAAFANSPAETKTETEKAFIRGFAEQMGNIGAIVQFVITAVFITILLVALNTMAQAVRERTNEIGVMKALGFGDVQVLAFVLVESLLIAIVGGGIGLLLGALLVMRGDPTGGALPIFRFPPSDQIVAAVVVLLLGLVAGAWPAIQAMRLKAVDALRKE
ncbi:MAG TPA: FtsX-like permease family protein [Thermoanaerobaculia bacterium]|jgi:putative ABC transport system permease protein|nr:FtsX-like permease family protein [Thermoanaerobaculia bacterium]